MLQKNMAILIIVINHQQQKIKSTEGEQLTRRKLLQNNLCEVVESRSHKCEEGERERERNCKLSCDKLTAAAAASFAFEAYVRNVMLIDFR